MMWRLGKKKQTKKHKKRPSLPSVVAQVQNRDKHVCEATTDENLCMMRREGGAYMHVSIEPIYL